jgi:HD superfamily phosphohydrolase
LMRKFKECQPELNISTRDMKNVTVAGLIHDLGHGPFSHSFEKWIKSTKPEINFHHETMSQKMFRHMIDDNQIELFDDDDTCFIEELITGEYSKKNEEKSWMFEIVANMRNSVDVDKFDYVARDCYNCGIKSSYDFARLMIFSRVINNEICFHQKEGWNLNNLFNTRYSLFKQVYSHKVGNAIEHMVADAFTLADPYMHISQRATEPTTYTHLTDCILKTIEASFEPELEPARAIIRRLRRRDLYRFVDETIIPGELISHWNVPSAAEVITCQSHDGIPLRVEDIIVDTHVNNYAMKHQNPIDNIHWFTKWDQTESFSMSQKDISLLAPSTFSEKYIRIYCKERSKVASAQKAWRNYLKITGKASASPQHLFPESGIKDVDTVKKKLF